MLGLDSRISLTRSMQVERISSGQLDGKRRVAGSLFPERIGHRQTLTLVFAAAALVPLVFALYTRHAWEDWYITYRASKNLAMGNGLVFTVGQRVQSFTSPLGTLLPALLAWLTRNDEAVLWLFRLLNCSFLGVAAVCLWQVSARLQFGGWARFLLLGTFVFESKIVDFSINGMEAAMMVLFLAVALYALIPGDGHGTQPSAALSPHPAGSAQPCPAAQVEQELCAPGTASGRARARR